MIQNRERLYINAVKGVAIVLMLWGHCIQYCAKDSFPVFDNSVFQFIYSFHMPLFMLISGYLFHFSLAKRDLKTILVHRIQGMLQPIVFANILNNILTALPTFLLYGTIELTDGALFEGSHILWFLWCVLSSCIAVALAVKLGRNRWQQLFLVLLGAFFVSLFKENYYHLFMYPYFVAGYYYGVCRKKLPAWSGCISLLSVPVFLLMVPFYEEKHFIYITPVYASGMDISQMISINGFRWGIGFAGSLFLLAVMDLLFKITVDRQKTPGILQMLGKLGENSLAVYCISVSLLSYYLPKIYDRFLLMTGRNIFAENMLVYNFIFTPVLTIIYSFGLYWVVQLMKRMKIHRLIFGR